MGGKISPLAPAEFPKLPIVPGVRLVTAEAGIKYKDRRDLLLAVLDAGTKVTGVFTKSRCSSAPVDWCRSILATGEARGLVVNSGNANAFTGKRGREAVEITANAAATALACQPNEIYLASTGVIGEPMDAGRFSGLLAEMAASERGDTWDQAARAIMTTDTFPKGASAMVDMDGQSVVVSGIAKGSGMIAPDMATMLCFVFTDAPISAGLLQSCLERAIETSFNAITVDSDTSTSDTVLAFATGTAAQKGLSGISNAADPRLIEFQYALDQVLTDLAIQVVRDGEGASKFITVEIVGAETDHSAKKIALSIANSPLVKTAVAGEDANWGRVVMAVGKAGEPADRDQLAIWFGDIQVAANGERAPNYDESIASRYMKRDEILIRADVGLGNGKARVWTCDLTKEYIAINADYRS